MRLLDKLVAVFRAREAIEGLEFVTVWTEPAEPIPALRERVKGVTRFHVRPTEFTRTIVPFDRIECDGEIYTILNTKQVSPGNRQLIELEAVGHE